MAEGNSIVGAVVKGVIKGGAQGSGTLNTPFKAVQAGGNAIQGIAKNLHSFDKVQKRKSHFKKKV